MTPVPAIEVPIDTPPSLRTQGAVTLGVAILAALFALPSLSAGFVFDDDFIIYQDDPGRALNHLVSEGRYGEILAVNYWYPRQAGLYRPLAILGFAAQYQAAAPATPLPPAAADVLEVPPEEVPKITLGAPDPRPFHVVNLALHAATSALLVLLLMPFGLLVAGLAGALFAVHPIHIDAISLVVGRCDLLAAFFGVLALIAHRRAVARGRAPAGHLLLIGGAFFLGLMSKESIAPLPALAAGLDLALERGGLRAILRLHYRLYLYELGLLAAVLVLRGIVLGDLVPGAANVSFVDNPLVEASTFERWAGALRILGLALGLLVWPWPLSIDYSYDSVPGVTDPLAWPTLAAAVALVSAAVFAWRLRGRAPGLLGGLLFFLLAYLPISHLLFPTGTLFGERTLYLPSIGFCLFAGALGSWVGRSRRGRAVVLGIGGAVVAAFFWLGLERYPELRSDRSAWQAAVETRPGSAKAWFNHAIGAMKSGELEEAEARIERAIAQADGRYPRAYDLAGDLAQRQAAEIDARGESAASEQERAELDRRFRAALERGLARFEEMLESARAEPVEQRQSFIEEAVVRASELLVLLGRHAEVPPLLEQAKSLYPDSPRFAIVAARLALELRKPARAAGVCTEMLRELQSGDEVRANRAAIASLSFLLADATSQLGDGASAQEYLQQAVRTAILARELEKAAEWAAQLDPEVAPAHALAAIAFALNGDRAAAREAAERAVALDGESATYRALLAGLAP